MILNPGDLEMNWAVSLVITMTGQQFWHWIDGSPWCQASCSAHDDNPAQPRTTLHKIPTAPSGLTILVVISSWLPVVFPLVTVPNYLCSSQNHSVTTLSSCSCFLRLFTWQKLVHAHPVLLPARSDKGIFHLFSKVHNSSTQAFGPFPSPTLSLASLMPF